MKKTVLMFLLIISMAFFYQVPETNSKYYKEGKPLAYNILVERLNYQEVSVNKANIYTDANNDIFGAVARFTRSNLLLDDDISDTYYVTVDSACSIREVNTNNASVSINNNVATLVYSDENINADLNSLIAVYYSCDANAIKVGDYLHLEVTVKEVFNTESYEYTIGAGSTNYNYNLFLSEKTPDIENPSISGNVLKVPKEYPENIFAYINTNFITDVDDQYYFKSKYNATNIKTDQGLKGLTVTDDTNYYYYTLDSNFNSYALTSSASGTSYYFTNTSNTASEDLALLREYLDMYTSYTTQEKNDLIAYISNNATIRNIIAGTTTLTGVEKASNKSIRITDDVWKVIYPPEVDSIEVSWNADVFTIFSDFLEKFENSFSYVNSENKSAILNDANIGTILSTQPTTDAIYYVGPYENNGQKVIGLILANSDPTPGTFTFIIYEVAAGNTYDLDFMLSSIDPTDISSVVAVLNEFDSDVANGITYEMLTTSGTYQINGTAVSTSVGAAVVNVVFTS